MPEDIALARRSSVDDSMKRLDSRWIIPFALYGELGSGVELGPRQEDGKEESQPR